MRHFVESLRYIICHSLISPKSIKKPSNSIKCNCEKVCSWLGSFSWTETILVIRKQAILLEVIGKPIRLDLQKLFVCHHPTLGLKVGSLGWDFFYFGECQSRSQGLTAFLYKFVCGEKKPLSVTIVIIDSDKALVNQRNEGIRFN